MKHSGIRNSAANWFACGSAKRKDGVPSPRFARASGIFVVDFSGLKFLYPKHFCRVFQSLDHASAGGALAQARVYEG